MTSLARGRSHALADRLHRLRDMRRLLLLAPFVVFACGSDPSPPPAAPASDAGPDVTVADAGVADAGGGSERATTAGRCGAPLTSMRFGDGPETRIFSTEEGVHGLAFASDGSLYVTGEYRGAADFGGGARDAGGANASLGLFKLDASGNHVWSKGFGDPSPGLLVAPGSHGHAVAATPSGGVVVVGEFAGNVDFGGGTLANAGPDTDAGAPDGGVTLGGCITGVADCAHDVVVVSFAANGAHQWSRRFGAGGGDAARAVAVDPAGNVYVTGSFEGTVSFGGDPLVASGKSDVFALKLDANGNHVWSKRFGGVENETALAIAVDASGSVYLGGQYSGIALFGTTGLVSKGPFDGFVARLDPSGDPLWAQRLVSEQGFVSGLALVPGGDVVLAGRFRTAMNFGALGGQKSAYADDAFVARMTAAGGVTWVKAFGNDGLDYATAIAVSADGSIHLTGRNDSPRGIDFGGGRVGGGLYSGVFVATLTSDGTHVCSRSYSAVDDGSPLPDGAIRTVGALGAAIAVAPDGRIAVGGGFGSTLDLGKGPMKSTGGTDGFIGSYAAAP